MLLAARLPWLGVRKGGRTHRSSRKAAVMALDCAHRHELRLLAASRPVFPVLLTMGRFAGPIRRIPGVGWLVSDPIIARRILTDPDHFTIVRRRWSLGRPDRGCGAAPPNSSPAVRSTSPTWPGSLSAASLPICSD